jgi:acetyl esterase
VPLDPQVQAMRLRRERDQVPPLYTMALDEARAADLASIQAASGDVLPVYQVLNEAFEGPQGRLPARVYRPAPQPGLPVLVYFFGGGWTLGTIDTCDAVCRQLANQAGCIVVAIGYRLAPEHKFPAAVDDCYAGARWVARRAAQFGGDPGRIAVGGDSAGGNLAAVVSLKARDDPALHLVAQLLVYPNTDFRSTSGSMAVQADPYLFNPKSVAWYWDHYLRSDQDGDNPLASPLRATNLSDLPPALVITAEFDPLRDQAEQYAQRMSSEGVAVRLSRYPGMVHGFFCMSGELDGGRQAIGEAAEYLRDRFAALAPPRPIGTARRPGRGGVVRPAHRVPVKKPRR